MLKLFTAQNSICTQKVFLTMSEKGLNLNLNTSIFLRTSSTTPNILSSIPKASYRR